jgi:hypothetical protein
MATAQFEYPVEEWFTGDYARIPERMQNALREYVINRHETGDFLKAVICNDLRNAVGRADDDNLPLIPLYVRWFHNIAPASCHGSHRAMDEWVNRLDNLRHATETKIGAGSVTDAIVEYGRTAQSWAQEDM